MAAQDKLVTGITKCPRCGAAHERIVLRAFDKPTDPEFKWYGECPDTKQPLTAKVKFEVEAR